MIGCIRHVQSPSEVRSYNSFILSLPYEYKWMLQRSRNQSCISLHSCINHCLLFNSDFIMESMKIILKSNPDRDVSLTRPETFHFVYLLNLTCTLIWLSIWIANILIWMCHIVPVGEHEKSEKSQCSFVQKQILKIMTHCSSSLYVCVIAV